MDACAHGAQVCVRARTHAHTRAHTHGMHVPCPWTNRSAPANESPRRAARHVAPPPAAATRPGGATARTVCAHMTGCHARRATSCRPWDEGRHPSPSSPSWGPPHHPPHVSLVRQGLHLLLRGVLPLFLRLLGLPHRLRLLRRVFRRARPHLLRLLRQVVERLLLHLLPARRERLLPALLHHDELQEVGLRVALEPGRAHRHALECGGARPLELPEGLSSRP